MPPSNHPLEDRLQKLEQEMTFLKSQGLSPDEHDRLLEESPGERGDSEAGGVGRWLPKINFLILLSILAFLAWREWQNNRGPKGDGGLENEAQEEPKKPQTPFLLPSRK